MKFKHIAKLIKHARIHSKQKLSQRGLGRSLGHKNGGEFISNIERGLCSVPDKMIVPIAWALYLNPMHIKNAKLKDMDCIITRVIIIENDSAFRPTPHVEGEDYKDYDNE